jgi:membrane-associated phospholipid phosphatase
MMWNFVTDLGDSAITLPLTALTIVFLLFSRWTRAAVVLALAIGGCALMIGMLKLVFQSCSHRLIDDGVLNPSGHMAMSTAVYGSLAALLSCSLSARFRWLPIALAGLLAGAIGISRVVLHAHTATDVACGFVIGLVAAILFDRLLRAEPVTRLQVSWLSFAALAVIAGMHGSRWTIEDSVHRMIAAFRHAVPQCAHAVARLPEDREFTI